MYVFKPLQRNRTILAISLGSAKRPIGTCDDINFFSSSDRDCFVNSVSVKPGETALTNILDEAYSTAMDRVNPTKPVLDVVYNDRPDLLISLQIEAIFTILP